MLMTYRMSYVLCLIHVMYFSLMLGCVMLTGDSFALVGWTSTPKGGLYRYDCPVWKVKVETVGHSSHKRERIDLYFQYE